MIGLYVIGLILFWLIISWIMSISQTIAWIAYLFAPLVLSGWWWWWQKNYSIFVWVKVYSLVFSICWVLLFREGRINKERGILGIELCFIFNILEAVITDALGKTLPQYLNTISGVLLIASLPRSDSVIRVGKGNLIWEIPLVWIISYTIWNITFIYLDFPHLIYDHIALLTATSVIALWHRESWIQARAFTLGLYMIGRQAYAPFCHINATRDININVAFGSSMISLLFGMISFINYSTSSCSELVANKDK